MDAVEESSHGRDTFFHGGGGFSHGICFPWSSCAVKACVCAAPASPRGVRWRGTSVGGAGGARGIDVGLYHTPQEANGVVCVGLLWQVGVGRSVRFEPVGALAAVGHEGYA